MITYIPIETTWQEFRDQFNSTVAEKLPIKVTHKIYGEGLITEAKADPTDCIITFTYKEQSKRLALTWLLKNAFLKASDEAEAFTELCEIVSTSYNNRAQELAEEDHLAKEAKRAAEAAAAKAEADKKKKAKIAAQVKTLRPEAISSDYELLGWMARNVSNIWATVPSDYESWFASHFGEIKHTIVDSNATTSGGNPMKFSISFHASFKKELPLLLQDKPGVRKKAICSVPYIWDLVENHGFKFGKVQDFNEIRSHIPAAYLSEFEAGLGPEPVKKTKARKIKVVA